MLRKCSRFTHPVPLSTEHKHHTNQTAILHSEVIFSSLQHVQKKKKKEQLASFLRSIAVWQDNLVIIYAIVETCSLATWRLCTAIKIFSQDGRPSGGQHSRTSNEEQWRNKGTLYFALICGMCQSITHTHTHTVGLWTRAEPIQAHERALLAGNRALGP